MTQIKALSYLMALLILIGCQEESKQSSSKIDKPVRKVTIEDVDKGIRANIDQRVKEGNGFFNFQKDTIDLSLKLVRVHTEYLSVLSQNEFFACVDLATEDGDVYDVDFFLKGTPGNMKVTRTDVHKLNGKPYYTWKKDKNKSWFTVPVKNASNDLLGVIETADEFEFTYEVELPELTGKSDLWLPLAQSDAFQDIEILSIEAPGKQQNITEETNGNSILYLSLDKQHSNEKINIKYWVKRKEKSAYAAEETDFQPYLAAAPLLPVGDRFGLIANEAINERQANTPLTKARALYDYIIDNMRYAKEGTYGTGDANYACDAKSGNCTEFHSFFISLARSAGIPARFAVGAAIPSARNDGGVDGYHCWAEFYAEGKWWPVDISEANKYTPLATYYFGHHPANRIEFSRGRNLILNPAPKSGPINFLAYPVLEIEGEQWFGVKTKFSFLRPDKAST
ncbi:MAG: transglutaminase domain-containing protein [Cyclobacteriaceae bacterium]